jgi:hypothetical protein
VVYQEQLQKLNPGFDDCPEPCFQQQDEGCTVDLSDLCETCEVRIQFRFFAEAARHELSLHFPGGCEWSFDSLYADVVKVMRIDGQLKGKGFPRDCDALTAAALRIWRSEEWRPMRIARWERAQKGTGNNG